jgi:predicted transcriptional regulator
MRADTALLLSLRPRFANALVGGEKTVELRRTRPASATPGQLVLLYAASPDRQMVGTATVASIDVASPDEIWLAHREGVAISRLEFDQYFDGASTAVAIVIEEAKALGRPRPLDELRRRWRGFRPPQSFRYVEPAEVAGLSLG